MNDPATILIEPAAALDLRELALLFDAYRVFYQAASMAAESQIFVQHLLRNGHTRFFLAREANHAPALGFVHLIPSFNTVAMRPIWYLEDLYVAPEGRRRGIATALMRHAENYARQTGAERLTLATAHDNDHAQSLYRELGYQSEDHFTYYHRILD